jgi:hypothetical protein
MSYGRRLLRAVRLISWDKACNAAEVKKAFGRFRRDPRLAQVRQKHARLKEALEVVREQARQRDRELENDIARVVYEYELMVYELWAESVSRA